MTTRVILEFESDQDADTFIRNVREREVVLTLNPDTMGGVSNDEYQHYPKLIERREDL